MKSFDEILPTVIAVLEPYKGAALESIGKLLINRDLNGRVRLIVSEELKQNAVAMEVVQSVAKDILGALEGRAYPVDRAVIFERDLDKTRLDSPSFPLKGYDQVFVIDRLVTEGNWSSIAPESVGAHRIVFFSIKGGVGRSSALAATAWTLAQAGKRVLILDLDLESPGISTSLLPTNKQPTYGITDWLVEDLVDNSQRILEAMVATSDLSHDGEIYVVPAHGADPGEYVSKLGRVWMSKLLQGGSRETWSERLKRLISNLEDRIKPDVILIDSRAGIDEVASSCVTDLGASLVLLFAIEGRQTWTGYQILFDYWYRAAVVGEIRQRLQIVSALTPETDQIQYLEGLRERAYDLFLNTQYDEIPPGEAVDDRWNFEAADTAAPHYPWEIRWHRSFAGIKSIHGRLTEIDAAEVRAIFGAVIVGVEQMIGVERNNG